MLAAASSAWGSYLCDVERVEVIEPQDPHGIWELIVVAPWSDLTVLHADGTKEFQDPDFQRMEAESRYKEELAKPKKLRRNLERPPIGWPPRFIFRDGDQAYRFAVHSSCKLFVRSSNGKLGLELTATGCQPFEGCSSVSKFIVPLLPFTP